MAGPISRVPRGLSSLLQLRGGLGINPAELAEFVLPQLDMLAFYQADNRERAVDSIFVPAGSVTPGADILGSPFTHVPDDELHIVWHLGYFTDPLPAITLRCIPIMQVGGSLNVTVMPNVSESYAGNDVLVMTMEQMPVFALPGTKFGFKVLQKTGVSAIVTMNWNKEFTRLQL